MSIMKAKTEKFIWKAEFEKEFQNYYRSGSETGKPKLFLEVHHVDGDGVYFLNMTNLIVLFIFEKYNISNWFQLNIIFKTESANETNRNVSEDVIIKYHRGNAHIPIEHSTNSNMLPKEVTSCQRPSVFLEGSTNFIISGLTPVLRFLIKYSMCNLAALTCPEDNEDQTTASTSVFEKLLGHCGACLSACAEASTWTTFCEVDMSHRMIADLVETIAKCKTVGGITLPVDLVRFEYHLGHPTTADKLQKTFLSRQGSESRTSRTNCKTNTLDQSWNFTEGKYPTLSDVLLFCPVHLSVQVLSQEVFRIHLPLLTNWYTRMAEILDAASLKLSIAAPDDKTADIADTLAGCKIANFTVSLPHVPFESLYKRGPPKDNKWEMREYTRQEDVEEAFQFLEDNGIESLELALEDLSLESLLNWDKVPVSIHPVGGHLPESRRLRKGHQLANVLQMVEFVYNERLKQFPLQKTTIVDFCSGGGHLGILVAWKLPKTEVILVENKGESVRRSQDRIRSLGLRNIKLFQCNLTSFCGQFDIGIALHACGSSTDLVLNKCEQNNAAFVVSPCCYGSIRNTEFIQYPRSQKFMSSGLSHRQYLILAHASDQTHDETISKSPQGYRSMMLVDSDRLTYFEERGRKVWLKKMTPETASPKNHILVGIPPQIGSVALAAVTQ